ncbi:MAG: hypothetical protein ACJ76Z_10385 [Thermoleophilaceae bacterium]
MAKDTIDRVKQNIRERLDELESERDQLLGALKALNGGGSSPVRRRGRPPGSTARKAASRRRAPRGQRRQQVLDALKDNELGPSAIAREIGGVNPTQISGLLRQLATEGVVARTAGGKWRLTPAAEHQQSAPAAEPAAAPAQTDQPG